MILTTFLTVRYKFNGQYLFQLTMQIGRVESKYKQSSTINKTPAKTSISDRLATSIKTPMSGGDRKGEEVMDGAGQAGRGAGDVESLVDSFCGVTSASREEALFFLESHGWQLDPAIESFYEDQPPEEEEENAEEEEGEGEGEEREGEEADSDDEDYVPSENEVADNAAVAHSSVAVRVSESGSRRKEKVGKSSSSRRSAFTTFSDLKRKAESDSDCDTDSDEDQDYYTGGEKR